MWLSIATLVLGTAPGQEAGQEAFKKMEQQVLKSKSLQVEWSAASEPDKDDTFKGQMFIADGNKMRLEVNGTVKGKPIEMVMVSDGTTMRMTGTNRKPKDTKVSTHTNQIAQASVTRTGIFLPLFLLAELGEPAKNPKDFDLEKEFALSDITLGKKEAIAGKEAQIVDYKITVKKLVAPLAVIVWIDVKTNLPLKRVVKAEIGREKFSVTETYTKMTLDEKIDDKEFELQK